MAPTAGSVRAVRREWSEVHGPYCQLPRRFHAHSVRISSGPADPALSQTISVYSRCFRCDRSLGKNGELAHLPVGRRIAFDSKKGRIWVICMRCDQWNLVPIEERWEAV